MKQLILFYLVIAVCICGCRSELSDKTKDFIPGTYIRFSEHEYGKEYDTLVISLQSPRQYSIRRKWKYERVLDGKLIEPEYKQRTTSGRYNKEHKLLEEFESGALMSFDIKQELLFNGNTHYKKL